MSIDLMRQQFETAFAEKLVSELREKAPGISTEAAGLIVRSQWLERKGDGYAAVVPDYGWWAWQASRAGVVVELPFLFPFYREGVKAAIEDHGCKVAEFKVTP